MDSAQGDRERVEDLVNGVAAATGAEARRYPSPEKQSGVW
jgi:hypothetical protein